MSCSVTQGPSYPLMFNLVPLGGTSTPGWEPHRIYGQLSSVPRPSVVPNSATEM